MYVQNRNSSNVNVNVNLVNQVVLCHCVKTSAESDCLIHFYILLFLCWCEHLQKLADTKLVYYNGSIVMGQYEMFTSSCVDTSRSVQQEKTNTLCLLWFDM